MTEAEMREQFCEIGRRCWQRGWVAANDGNFSVRLGENVFLVTPTGVSKGFMTPEMLLLVDSDCRALSNTGGKPSSELKMHMRCYRERPDIRAVVHAHPPASTAFAAARLPLDAPILSEFLMSLKEVPVAPYATPGTDEVPDSITPLLPSHNAVLLANHGAVTLGETLMQAYYRLESLEHTAEIFLSARLLGGGVPLTPEQAARLKAF
jgi:L-fuculose-phosphate aldolase